MMRSLAVFLSAAVTVAGLISSIAANAQSIQAPAPELSSTASSITDQKLDAVVAAMERVATLQEAYRDRLVKASTESDEQRIVEEANSALTKAVADQGLSVEEYNSIIELAQNDLNIRGKLLERMHPR
jgi:hypothetical protein